ncbi:hypothetical protein CDEF62S_04353 [Castellaniella defragrans]
MPVLPTCCTDLDAEAPWPRPVLRGPGAARSQWPARPGCVRCGPIRRVSSGISLSLRAKLASRRYTARRSVTGATSISTIFRRWLGGRRRAAGPMGPCRRAFLGGRLHDDLYTVQRIGSPAGQKQTVALYRQVVDEGAGASRSTASQEGATVLGESYHSNNSTAPVCRVELTLAKDLLKTEVAGPCTTYHGASCGSMASWHGAGDVAAGRTVRGYRFAAWKRGSS